MEIVPNFFASAAMTLHPDSVTKDSGDASKQPILNRIAHLPLQKQVKEKKSTHKLNNDLSQIFSQSLGHYTPRD
jgi:hypothetical protein